MTMTALPSKHSSGCHMATEREDDQRTTPRKERDIWRRRCGQQDTDKTNIIEIKIE